MKFLLYQILAVAIVLIGMAFFFNELHDSGQMIFYLAVSWLLLLIVLLIKELIRKRKK